MIRVKYQNVKLDLVEREREIEYLPDAHMSDIVRFLKDSVPKVENDDFIYFSWILVTWPKFLEQGHCVCEFEGRP